MLSVGFEDCGGEVSGRSRGFSLDVSSSADEICDLNVAG